MKVDVKILSVILGMFVFMSCSKTNNPGDDDDTTPINPPELNIPDNNVVAHRGAWKEFALPDNSIAALEKAIDLKCYASECDVMMTSDKKVIVYHDEKIGGQYFKDISYASLNASHSLKNGEKIPLLSDFIDKVLANGKINLWIDIKSLTDQAGGNDWSSLTAEAAAEVIRSKKVQKQVSYVVGRKAVLDRSIAAAKGEWKCGYMNTDYTPEQFVANGYTWANFSYNKFYTNSNNNSVALIADYKAKKINVTVYTVDDTEAMSWFLANKDVSAVTTNYPFMLLQKIRNK